MIYVLEYMKNPMLIWRGIIWGRYILSVVDDLNMNGDNI